MADEILLHCVVGNWVWEIMVTGKLKGSSITSVRCLLRSLNITSRQVRVVKTGGGGGVRGSRSRFTENKTVLSQFTKNKVIMKITGGGG